LWGAMGERECGLIHAKWPEPEARVDDLAKSEVEWLTKLVAEIRSVRTELNVPPSAIMVAEARDANEFTRTRIARHYETIRRMARTHIPIDRNTQSQRPAFLLDDGDYMVAIGTVQVIVAGTTYSINLNGVIDLTAERLRLTNAITATTKERDALVGRLNNPAFVEKAKPEAVEKARADHAEKSAEVDRLQAALARLG
jgi:valyl-tRNA synthetase